MKSNELENKIKDYIEPPHFQDVVNHAIVIKGDWGSGKTYFIKKLLRERFDNNIYQIYVSLYGLTNIQELDKAIKAAFIPLIDNKVIKLVKDNSDLLEDISKMIIPKKADKTSIFVSKEMISFLWRIGIDIIQTYKKKDNKRIIFVIDDVERCKIPINNVFGYFSNVLSSNYIIFDNNNNIKHNFDKNRIIFILNEKELDNQLEDYKKTKEKIIGMEYELYPDIKVVLDGYNYEIDSKNTTITAELINNKIKNICETFQFYNLRMIKYTQQYIKTILFELQKNQKELNSEYVIELTKYVTLIMIQKIKGNITKKEQINLSLQSYCDKKELWNPILSNKDQVRKFEINTIPLHDLFYEILFNGTFDSEKIQNDYEKWIAFNIEKEGFKKLCSKYIYMKDNDFEKLYNEFDEKFQKNEILNMNDLYSYYEFKYDLVRKKILSNTTIKKLDKEFEDYFKKNESRLDYEGFAFDYDDIRELGYEYKSEHNGQLMPKFMDKMIQMSLNHFDPNFYFQHFVASYSNTNLNDMITFIENVNPDFEEFTIPILANIKDLDEYFDYLQKFDSLGQMKIYESFKKRYKEILYWNKNSCCSSIIYAYLADVEYLKKIGKLYMNSKYKTDMSPENYIRRELGEQYLSLCKLDSRVK